MSSGYGSPGCRIAFSRYCEVSSSRKLVVGGIRVIGIISDSPAEFAVADYCIMEVVKIIRCPARHVAL